MIPEERHARLQGEIRKRTIHPEGLGSKERLVEWHHPVGFYQFVKTSANIAQNK